MGISQKFRLRCPFCKSLRMKVYEGKNILKEVRYEDGSGTNEQIDYPLEIRCGRCGNIVRQEGGPVV